MQLARMTRGKIAVAALVGATVVGGGAGAALTASTSSASATAPTPTTPTPATAPASSSPAGAKAGKAAAKAGKAHRKARSVLAHADYATVELRKGTTWVTTTYNRGTVTAASGSSISLHRPDGQNVTVAITPATKFKGVTSASQLTTGKQALVLSVGNQATHIAEKT